MRFSGGNCPVGHDRVDISGSHHVEGRVGYLDGPEVGP